MLYFEQLLLFITNCGRGKVVEFVSLFNVYVVKLILLNVLAFILCVEVSLIWYEVLDESNLWYLLNI